MSKQAFKVIRYRNIDVFEGTVSQHLNDGWELAGDMFIYTYGEEKPQYCQPVKKVIKRKYTKKKTPAGLTHV
jgi:hypothetical protein